MLPRMTNALDIKQLTDLVTELRKAHEAFDALQLEKNHVTDTRLATMTINDRAVPVPLSGEIVTLLAERLNDRIVRVEMEIRQLFHVHDTSTAIPVIQRRLRRLDKDSMADTISVLEEILEDLRMRKISEAKLETEGEGASTR